jgi:hypothetical protein
MKIDKLKKQIKYSAISIVTLVTLISILLIMYIYINNSFLDQYDKIIMDIADIKNKTQEIEQKTQQNKKYMEMWSKISQSKKSLEGIKVDDINKLVANLGEKYSITNTVFKISVPENFPPSVYKNDTISLLYSIGELTFKSFNDIKAIQFANEFIKYLHGYPIITRFEFIKEKDYEIKDYFDISTGKISGAIQGRLVFSWFVYKENISKNDSPSN